MRKWIFALLALVLLAGCAKRTNPKNVERRITKGSWTVASFSIGGESLAENYAFYAFTFKESGETMVLGQDGDVFTGSWNLGLNRNPAVLYLNFPPGGGLEYLADDWEVVKSTRSELKLERNGSGGSTSVLVFRK